MNDKLIGLELQLLIARHGRSRVLATLAQLESKTLEDLEAEMAILLAKPKKTKPPKLDFMTAVTNEATGLDSDRQALLTELATAFLSKSIFPNLRDISSFLAQKQDRPKKYKSRSDAAIPLFKFLAKLDRQQLRAIAANIHVEARGDLHVIAQGILNRPD